MSPNRVDQFGVTEPITSPTFTLVNQYPRMPDNRILYHIDCYRLETAGDIISAGLEDILLAECSYMIEWPERIDDYLPADRLWIEMSHVNETRRKLRFIASEGRSTELLKAFRRSAFGV